MSDSDRTPHRVDLHVGARIRARRKLMGVSQEALAGHLGLTFQQVQKYERGANRVSASKLWEIARALQCSLDDFFDGMVDEGGVPIEIDDRPDPLTQLGGLTGGRDLAVAYIALGPEARRSLVNVAGTIVEATRIAAGGTASAPALEAA